MMGIIGGTGLYRLEGLTETNAKGVWTPYGAPSAEITVGHYGVNQVAFIPRHGARHELLPSEVNYRANIWALKSLGVRAILSVSAVGSLTTEIEPGTLVLPTQVLDFTSGNRPSTFFGGGLVGHISSADPICRRLVECVRDGAPPDSGISARELTYGCVEGPRLGTRAEGRFLIGSGCHVVGMTNAPEAFLAMEAQLCYASIGVVTDFDSGVGVFRTDTTAESIIRKYQESLVRVQSVLRSLLSDERCSDICRCRTSLSGAILTRDADMTEAQRQTLEVLLR